MKLRLNRVGALCLALMTMFIVLVAGDVAETNGDSQIEASPTPVSEPPHKLVHVLNPGERENLSPNLIGVQNIAMTFLPLTMNFVNIIDAFREVVNGVRYEIVLNAVDTKANDADIICRLVILEKPWLRTEWGDKIRELQNSNCTSDDRTEAGMNPADRMRALNDKYTRNAIFNGGTRNELSSDEMSKLEAQIIPFAISGKRKKMPTIAATIATTTTTTTTTPPSLQALTTSTVAVESDVHATADEDIAATTAVPGNEDATGTPANIEAVQTEVAAGLAAEEVPDATTLAPGELNDNEKKWLDDLLSVGAVNFEDSQRGNRFGSDAADGTTTGNQKGVANSDSDVNGDANNYKREEGSADNYRQREQVVEEQQQRQQHQQLQQQVVLVDRGMLHGQEINEDSATPQQEASYRFGKNVDVVPLTDNEEHHQRQFVGGVSDLDHGEAQNRLQSSLDTLGPKYTINKIHSATTQLVAGTLTKIDAELIDSNGTPKRCQIEIYARPWITQERPDITIDCPYQETIATRHRRAITEQLEKKNGEHKKHDHHRLGKTEHLFHKFQTKFQRRYHTSMEHQMRLRIFKQNLKIIKELNEHEQGSAKYGITEFADLTSSEYKMRTGMWQRSVGFGSSRPVAEIPNVELPKEFDWREKNAISKVKNQGSCGSCWAFSVTGNIEGLHAVKTNKLEEYSEQELLDCDTIDSACNGGLPDNAYKAIQDIGGLELESDYPYEGRKMQCHFNKTKVHVKVRGFVDMPKNETAMAQWLIVNGPISIGINANAMQFYRGGVSHPWRALCSKKNLDHGVLIVGYGVSDYPNFKKTLPYWIIKNSWGPKWGEQGYYRVYRGDNTCGVSEMASSAVLEN